MRLSMILKTHIVILDSLSSYAAIIKPLKGPVEIIMNIK
jgi:hypothetical protein